MIGKSKKILRTILRQCQYKTLLDDQSFLSYRSDLKNRPQHGRILVVPPDDPGSLGDEAMVEVIRQKADSLGLSVLCTKRDEKSVDFYGIDSYVDYKSLNSSAGLARTLSMVDGVWIVGADIIDGHYNYIDAVFRIRLASIAASLGYDSRILGFSFNNIPHQKVVDEMKRIHSDVKIFLRDPISYNRITSLLNGKATAMLVSDLAFQLRPTEHECEEYLEWIDKERGRGRNVVGINLSPMYALDSGLSIVDRLVNSVSSTINKMENVSFIFIPHDYRERFGDVSVLKNVYELLHEEVKKNVKFVEERIRPTQAKEIASHLDFIVSGRMHLVIAAAGSGTPAGGITYQGKFEGLAAHLGLEPSAVISPDAAADADKFMVFMTNWLECYSARKRHIQERLDRLIELSKSQLENV